jgi:uncharacterized protein
MTGRGIIDQVRAVLGDRDDVVAARVFGSLARGAESPNDVDLAVVLDAPARSATRCSAIADAVERAVGLPVDCREFEQLPLVIRFRVLREGELIVDRDPARRTRLESRTMLAYYDFAPYLERIRRAAVRRLARGNARV